MDDWMDDWMDGQMEGGAVHATHGQPSKKGYQDQGRGMDDWMDGWIDERCSCNTWATFKRDILGYDGGNLGNADKD